ncbi:hypothetical protein [Limnobacter parvus]|uniref:Uncharacterized protein n=1 Tax=Limnobacter parvus TaxID=2939690 RepID=A0ABT1XD00_9BURK|nr:hypothetical protein [Limnobacter parvus]MCR2745145.1 hypothetical protein [Limnobacter parvus]
MNTFPSTAEVWIIHESQALLFRRRDQQWQQEIAMPFNEFLGSATALSSFTLPDTSIHINLKNTQNPEQSGQGKCWVGLCHDPLRLIEVQDNQIHTRQLHEIRTMGKVARTICVDKPQNFERGIEMMLVHAQEHQHLKNWLASQKSGARKFSGGLQLCAALWLKAESSYQHLRLAALACTALSLGVMNWNMEQQLEKQGHQIERSIQLSRTKAAAEPAAMSFEQWSEQINKFGKSNRANLQSLNIHWNNNGDVYSYAVLERERKRVPKGCTLETPVRVQCSAKASAR